jgi:hypothetical protein
MDAYSRLNALMKGLTGFPDSLYVCNGACSDDLFQDIKSGISDLTIWSVVTYEHEYYWHTCARHEQT